MKTGYAYASRFQHSHMIHLLSAAPTKHSVATACSEARAIALPENDSRGGRLTCDKCKSIVARRAQPELSVA